MMYVSPYTLPPFIESERTWERFYIKGVRGTAGVVVYFLVAFVKDQGGHRAKISGPRRNSGRQTRFHAKKDCKDAVVRPPSTILPPHQQNPS